VQRVEPSVRGGAKMACALVDALFGSSDEEALPSGGAAAAPTNSSMIGARVW